MHMGVTACPQHVVRPGIGQQLRVAFDGIKGFLYPASTTPFKRNCVAQPARGTHLTLRGIPRKVRELHQIRCCELFRYLGYDGEHYDAIELVADGREFRLADFASIEGLEVVIGFDDFVAIAGLRETSCK